jgi:hypothetical protein
MAPLILAAVTAASAAYSVNRGMHNERIQERATRDQRADNQRREDQLANEAKAKAAADEKMKTAGQRAGINYGFGGAGGNGLNFMSMFRPAPARPVEDNIGRGSLFGN